MLYCGIEKDDYRDIRAMIWERNRSILKATSLSSAILGIIFLIINTLTYSSVLLPYLFLASGSAVISAFVWLMPATKKEKVCFNLCYLQMLLVSVYAAILSTQPSNYSIPATSIVVFVAIMPLDVINLITFSFVGMVFYGVICTRNVREIYQKSKVEKIQREIVSSLAAVVEERDEMTGSHIQRTEEYVTALIYRMKETDKYSGLSPEYCQNVILAAKMHDIGKIKIPDVILNKPGRLTEEEYEVMKKHAEYGSDIITRIMGKVEEKEYCDIACNIAKYHHERYDGKGYPSGISGDDIPLEARIMALADVYDALVSERVYKKALTKEEAQKIIYEGAGTQFDPDLARMFLEVADRF
ncbi:MAG: HD domain-containing protein [Clostridia bacterium]|nr:HD domain-containing protein [Clostridia bacterium]